jgi:hypothetical protein
MKISLQTGDNLLPLSYVLLQNLLILYVGFAIFAFSTFGWQILSIFVLGTETVLQYLLLTL